MKKTTLTCAAIIMSAAVALPASADLLGTKTQGSAKVGTSIQAPGVNIGAGTSANAGVAGSAAGTLNGSNDARGGILVNNNADIGADARANHNTAFETERATEEKPLARDFKITDKPVKKTRKRMNSTIDGTLDSASEVGSEMESNINLDADVRARATGNVNE